MSTVDIGGDVKKDVVASLNSMIEKVIKIDERKGDLDCNFKEFRANVKLILDKLYDERFNFGDSSTDDKFAVALNRYSQTFRKLEEFNAGDLCNVLSGLYKKLPWGGFASVFTHSVIKNLNAGFSKLVGKAKKFVKCFKARNKIVKQHRRKLGIFVKEAGKFLKSASQGKELDDVRGDIVDFVLCVRKICDDKFSGCVVESRAREVWEALRDCSSVNVKAMDGANLVNVLNTFAGVVGSNRDFFDSKDVYKVVDNLKDLIKSDEK